MTNLSGSSLLIKIALSLAFSSYERFPSGGNFSWEVNPYMELFHYYKCERSVEAL